MKVFLGGLLALLAGLTVLGVGVCAQPYTSVATLFEIGVGARPAGLGNAFVGLADDETAAFYNPAGLALADRFAVNSYFSWQFSSFAVFSVCLGGPHFGAAFLQLDSGSIDAIDAVGEPMGSFHYVSRGGVLSAGFSPVDHIAVGAKVKLYQSSSYNGVAFAASLSPTLLFYWNVFRLGLCFEDFLATPVYFSNGHLEGWTRDIRVGGAIRLGFLSGSLEVDNILAGRGAVTFPHAHVGLEGMFSPLALRMGFDQNALTFGMTVELGLIRLDYATALHYQLPMSHRVALSVFF